MRLTSKADWTSHLKFSHSWLSPIQSHDNLSPFRNVEEALHLCFVASGEHGTTVLSGVLAMRIPAEFSQCSSSAPDFTSCISAFRLMQSARYHTFLPGPRVEADLLICARKYHRQFLREPQSPI